MRIHSLAQQLQHQQQQKLWRPSEQVLHLLTECKQAPVVLEEKPSSSLLLSSSSSDEQQPMNVKRQAPTVWRPPVAMKSNCPPPQPLPTPVDDWKLPPQEQAEPKLLDPFTFLAGEDDQQHRQEQTQPPQVLNNASDEDEDEDIDVDPDDPDVDDHSQLKQKNSEGFPDELMPSSKIFSLASPPEISLGSQNLFMKQQQVVASTPLFAGLGSVSFGSGFSAPATSTIFGQSHGFGSGLNLSQQQGLISSQQQQQEEEEMADDQIQPAMVVKNSRFQRPGVSERGASFSEKGSSDSQSGKIKNKNSKVNVKVVDAQSKSGNGGFKPSGLAGKSLVIDPIDLLGGKAAAATSGRKLRTRTLDLLVNAIQTTAPKSLQQQQQQQENGSQAATPRTRSSSRTTPGASKLSNNSSSNMMTKNSSDHQNDDASAGRSAGKKPGAYFAHAGAWIVQKKSSRNAKNAFKKESVEVKEAADHRAGKEKEEEDDQQSIIPPRTKKSKPAAKSTPAMRNGNQSATEGKTATTKLTKKRSLTAMSQETTTTTKHQKPPSKKKKKKKDDDDYREEQSNGGDESRGPGRPSKAAALIRSKRGRCQVLPNRLQDSVMNKVKKTSRT